MFEKTKACCDGFLQMGVPGFDFLVYRDGKEFFRYMGGYSDLEEKTPIRGDERRWIYSLTKPITVTCALQLWEQGKFALDDHLSDYLPAFRDMTVRTETGIRKAENPITIHNVFQMTAGFSYDYHSPSVNALQEKVPEPTTRQVIDAMAQEPLLFEPGDQYRYSLGHDVLGALIEELSGEAFQDYAKTHIFAPLGMENTTLRLPESEYATVSSLYKFHAETGNRIRHPGADEYGYNYVSGGAGCVTTINDYMKFAEGLRTGEQLLKRSTIDAIQSNRLTAHQGRTYTVKNGEYGLGMWVPRAGHLRQDFGWGGAAGALLAVDPGRGLSMVYMQHMLSSPNQGLRSSMVETFLAELEGREDLPKIDSNYKNYHLTY